MSNSRLYVVEAGKHFVRHILELIRINQHLHEGGHAGEQRTEYHTDEQQEVNIIPFPFEQYFV